MRPPRTNYFGAIWTTGGLAIGLPPTSILTDFAASRLAGSVQCTHNIYPQRVYKALILRVVEYRHAHGRVVVGPGEARHRAGVVRGWATHPFDGFFGSRVRETHATCQAEGTSRNPKPRARQVSSHRPSSADQVLMRTPGSAGATRVARKHICRSGCFGPRRTDSG